MWSYSGILTESDVDPLLADPRLPGVLLARMFLTTEVLAVILITEVLAVIVAAITSTLALVITTPFAIAALLPAGGRCESWLRDHFLVGFANCVHVRHFDSGKRNTIEVELFCQ